MVKRYSQTQKFRAIINGVHFYTTARQIRNGVGDHTTTNDAIQKALDALEGMRPGACGLAGTWSNLQVQLDVMR